MEAVSQFLHLRDRGVLRVPLANEQVALGKILHRQRGDPIAEDQRNLMQPGEGDRAGDLQHALRPAAEDAAPRELAHDAELRPQRIQRLVGGLLHVAHLVADAGGDRRRLE